MSARYLVWLQHRGRQVPICNLPGSPYPSRKAAKAAATRAGIEQPRITTVRRSA